MPIAKLLIENKADPNSLDEQGNNGCPYAAGYGRKGMLGYLIGLGVRVNAKNNPGISPLAAAPKNNREGPLEILPKNGAS
eukprot:UN2883